MAYHFMDFLSTSDPIFRTYYRITRWNWNLVWGMGFIFILYSPKRNGDKQAHTHDFIVETYLQFYGGKSDSGPPKNTWNNELSMHQSNFLRYRK